MRTQRPEYDRGYTVFLCSFFSLNAKFLKTISVSPINGLVTKCLLEIVSYPFESPIYLHVFELTVFKMIFPYLNLVFLFAVGIWGFFTF